jgi:hypothetical protein
MMLTIVTGYFGGGVFIGLAAGMWLDYFLLSRKYKACKKLRNSSVVYLSNVKTRLKQNIDVLTEMKRLKDEVDKQVASCNHHK